MILDLCLAAWLGLSISRRLAEAGGARRAWLALPFLLLPLAGSGANALRLGAALLMATLLHRLPGRLPLAAATRGLAAPLLLLAVAPGLDAEPLAAQAAGWLGWIQSHPILARIPDGALHGLLVNLSTGWLAAVESHGIVRLLLSRYGFPPPGGSALSAESEARRGRVIGALERLAASLLVLNGRPEGLGLLLAVKGFARFKSLDEREFAEYVLIGTLFSVGGAVLLGLLLRPLL